MGLFSKHKKEEPKSMAPAPMAPPMPTVASTQSVPNPVETLEGSTLTPPQVPINNLDDIKSQVSNSTTNEIETNLAPEIVGDDSKDLFSSDNLNLEKNELFDFSDSPVDSQVNIEESFQVDSAPAVIDTHSENTSSLNFISRSSNLKNSDSTNNFLTTTEFKSLLEIIESVKGRIKNSSETHLRLLDIKSEEDIEFENLRKDFQFVEDKLYELDTLIFEK